MLHVHSYYTYEHLEGYIRQVLHAAVALTGFSYLPVQCSQRCNCTVLSLLLYIPTNVHKHTHDIHVTIVFRKCSQNDYYYYLYITCTLYKYILHCTRHAYIRIDTFHTYVTWVLFTFSNIVMCHRSINVINFCPFLSVMGINCINLIRIMVLVALSLSLSFALSLFLYLYISCVCVCLYGCSSFGLYSTYIILKWQIYYN